MRADPPEDRKQGEIFREVEPEDLLKYALFFLFFSAFGFFFSRLLLNWPFATLSSFRSR
jgi:hypothetical protein